MVPRSAVKAQTGASTVQAIFGAFSRIAHRQLKALPGRWRPGTPWPDPQSGSNPVASAVAGATSTRTEFSAGRAKQAHVVQRSRRSQDGSTRRRRGRVTSDRYAPMPTASTPPRARKSTSARCPCHPNNASPDEIPASPHAARPPIRRRRYRGSARRRQVDTMDTRILNASWAYRQRILGRAEAHPGQATPLTCAS
jgi:hypothetical protein